MACIVSNERRKQNESEMEMEEYLRIQLTRFDLLVYCCVSRKFTTGALVRADHDSLVAFFIGCTSHWNDNLVCNGKTAEGTEAT